MDTIQVIYELSVDHWLLLPSQPFPWIPHLHHLYAHYLNKAKPIAIFRANLLMKPTIEVFQLSH